jgi:hypothetical protein
MNMIFILLIAACSVSIGYAQWSTTPDTAKQVLLGSFFNKVIGDGQGNTIVIGRRGLYTAQKVDKNGQIIWDPSLQGMSVVIPDSANDGTFGSSYLWPDGKGGVFIAYDYYDFLQVITNPERVVIYDLDTYVQYLDDKGQRRWGNKGIPLSTLKGTNPLYYYVAHSQIKAFGSDGHGGLIAVWSFGTYDSAGNAVGGTYIQRIDAFGNLLLGANGKQVNNLVLAQVIIDGEGAVFMAISPNATNSNFSLLKFAIDGNLLWTRQTSIPIGDAIGERGKLISDGAGGCYAIVRFEQNSLKAYWIDSNGNQPWGGNGVVVVPNVNQFDFIQDVIIHPDGGIICLWSDFRSGIRDLFTQYVNNSGQLKWGAMGLAISTAQTGKFGGKLLKSSDNDFICLFGDFRNNAQLFYAQKIDKDGIIKWSNEGNLMSSRTLGGVPISDGAGGAIAAWGEPGPIRAVYLQKIDNSGKLGVVVSVNDQKEKNTPANFHLYQNHPNPFLNETTIQYSLASGPLPVSLKIYNLFGEEVVTLINQIQAPGQHTVRWSGVNQNGLPVVAGVYFYKLQIGPNHLLKKLAVIR